MNKSMIKIRYNRNRYNRGTIDTKEKKIHEEYRIVNWFNDFD